MEEIERKSEIEKIAKDCIDLNYELQMENQMLRVEMTRLNNMFEYYKEHFGAELDRKFDLGRTKGKLEVVLGGLHRRKA